MYDLTCVCSCVGYTTHRSQIFVTSYNGKIIRYVICTETDPPLSTEWRTYIDWHLATYYGPILYTPIIIVYRWHAVTAGHNVPSAKLTLKNSPDTCNIFYYHIPEPLILFSVLLTWPTLLHETKLRQCIYPLSMERSAWICILHECLLSNIHKFLYPIHSTLSTSKLAHPTSPPTH